MTLSNKSRGELESVRPGTLQETDDEILVRCLDSFDLWALKSDISVTPSLAAHGYWETWITSWFTRNIWKGDFVLDIGANCGYYTMLFERLVGSEGHVVAFEASPVYDALLAKTREHNNANFKVENVALSDKSGTIDLIYPGYYTGSASIMHGFDPKWGEEHAVTVKAETLDSFFEGESTMPDLVKIDAESAEEVIWKGGMSLWNSPNPPVIVLEYSQTGVYSDGFAEELLAYGDVTRIGYDGMEEPVTLEHIKGLTDWDMLVIRRKI